jgi:hypothetical protein
MSEKTIRYDPQKTTIIGEEEAVKRSKFPFIPILLAAAVIAVVVIILLLTGVFKKSEYESPTLRQMHKLVAKIRNLEVDVNEKQSEIFKLIKDYSEKTGQTFPSINALNLSEEEKKLLEEKIKEEKDISVKSLLSEILEKNEEISELNGKIELLEALLPKPHIVTKGENHYQISMNYLLNEKGVEKERAIKLVERTALFEPLIPGFKVWNFYTGDEYGTFITQGEAPISPNEIRRQAKKIITEARDRAIAEKDRLAQEIDILENRREQLISQLDHLGQEKISLIDQLSNLSQQNLTMQKAVNSLHFLLDLKSNLLDKGIIKGGFLRPTRLREVSPELFNQAVDLRRQDRIEISAAQFSLLRLRKIALYPRFYKRGIDYKVKITEDKKNATLTVLAIEKFKNERAVISVE